MLFRSSSRSTPSTKPAGRSPPALGEIGAILRDPSPYQRISELPSLGDAVRRAHDEVVRVGRSDLLDAMGAVMAEIRDYAASAGGDLPAGFVDGVERELAAKKDQALAADTRSQLDAFATQLDVWRNGKLAAVDRAIEAAREAAAREAAMRTRCEDDVVVKRPAPGTASHSAASGAADASCAPLAPSTEPRRPRTKTIERRDLCRATRLTSEADIDAYVEAIRKKLADALADNDSISVR